ncbi:MAG: hypothetical protein ACREJM_13185, partial [Candidatus Saccharimonadales bacterium]
HQRRIVDDIFNAGIKSYRKGDYVSAIAHLSAVVEDNQQHWLAWFYLGLAYLKSNDIDRGYRILRVVASMCPIDYLKAMSAALLPDDDDDLKLESEMAEAS